MDFFGPGPVIPTSVVITTTLLSRNEADFSPGQTVSPEVDETRDLFDGLFLGYIGRNQELHYLYV